jgi:hypothetical protein
MLVDVTHESRERCACHADGQPAPSVNRSYGRVERFDSPERGLIRRGLAPRRQRGQRREIYHI